MRTFLRIVFWIISVALFIVSGAWFYASPDYEPAVAFLAGFGGIVTLLASTPKPLQEVREKSSVVFSVIGFWPPYDRATLQLAYLAFSSMMAITLCLCFYNRRYGKPVAHFP
jgi:hypothetical protein